MFTLGSSEKKVSQPARAIAPLLKGFQDFALTWDTGGSFAPSAALLCFQTGSQRLYDEVYSARVSEAPKEVWTTEHYEFESFRLACLLFSSHGVEFEENRIDLRQSRILQLQRCLLHTEMTRYWNEIPGALIWCLAVGANESWEYEQFPWFMANLNPMLMMLSMECWKELERSLNTFGWLFRCGRAGTVLAR